MLALVLEPERERERDDLELRSSKCYIYSWIGVPGSVVCSSSAHGLLRWRSKRLRRFRGPPIFTEKSVQMLLTANKAQTDKPTTRCRPRFRGVDGFSAGAARPKQME